MTALNQFHPEQPGSPDADSPFHELYAASVQRGYEAANVALLEMQSAGYASESALYLCFCASFGEHGAGLSDEAAYCFAGYFAGAANLIREVMAIATRIPHEAIIN